MTYPTITVVIATYNSKNTLAMSLGSIVSQEYPKGKIDIIIVDGSSTDDTVTIAKRYTKKIIVIPPEKQNAEYNKSVGIAKARGELLLLVDHDNVLPHPTWLKRMVAPLRANPDIVASETLRYHYDPNASLLDRYFGLFGAGDPLAYYLGKADRLSHLTDTYNLYGDAVDRGDWWEVTFSPRFIPTLGANGFLIRRALLMKHAEVLGGKYYHIDVNVDLIRKGYRTYAFIKDTIIHLTGYNDIRHFLYRRKLFMEQFHLGSQGIEMKKERRYSVFEKRDTMKLVWFIVISLTIVKPLVDSIRGWRRIPDRAWFLHPVLCFGITVLYSWVVIRHQTRAYAKAILER